LDAYGEHAMSCPGRLGKTPRHEALKHGLGWIAQECGIEIEYEAVIRTEAQKLLRPGDVSFVSGNFTQDGSVLAIDVSVVNLFEGIDGPRYDPHALLEARVGEKNAKYLGVCVASVYLF
jgi:hypothetical protein